MHLSRLFSASIFVSLSISTLVSDQQVLENSHSGSNATVLYQSAMEILKTIPTMTPSERGEAVLRKYELVDDIQVKIPNDFLDVQPEATQEELLSNQKNALKYLEEASSMNHSDSTYLLGEIYLYGNYSYPRLANLALHYYERCSDISGNATAQFMAGFLYASGLLGQIPANQPKADLYFAAAAAALEPRALMTLAYRYYKGIATEKNEELALYYYSVLAKILYDNHVSAALPFGGPHLEAFSVRINDFNTFDFLNSANKHTNGNPRSGHGNNLNNNNGVFESPNSVQRTILDLLDKTMLSELNLDDSKYWYAKYYYQARVYYEGDYLNRRNYSRAFKYAFRCATAGTLSKPDIFKIDKLPLSESVLNSLDVHYIGKCVSMLGHLYFAGEGVEQSYIEAYNWFRKNYRIGLSPEGLVDMGMIYEFGILGISPPDPKLAETHYKTATKLGYARAFYHLARLALSIENKIFAPVIDINNGTSETPAEELYVNIESDYTESMIVSTFENAAARGDVAAIYELARLHELGFAYAHTSEIVSLYKLFIQQLEQYISPLEWSLQSVLLDDYMGALIGYSIASEQGFETAQSSAAFLLYQTPSKISGSPNISAERALQASNYLTKSSQQFNVDSTVLLGDMYYYNLLPAHDVNQTESAKRNFVKASTCYQSASHKHSSQASWNLGYMYENGIGVIKDFHLAKRYYDLALTNHPKAYLPVQISLIGLNIKVKLYRLFGWGVSTELAPESPKKHTLKDWWSLISKVRSKSASETDLVVEKQVSSDDVNEVAAEEYIVLAAFVGFLVTVYGTQWIIRRFRRGNRQEANGENEPPAPEPAQNFAFFMMIPI